MTDRRDIAPNAKNFRRLSYTCRCGWVDWGHALPGSALSLKRQLDAEKSDWPLLSDLSIEFNGSPAFVVFYGQSMGMGVVKVSTLRQWIVKKGLSKSQKKSVALAIYMAASHEFEHLQGSFPYSLITGSSSYSPEDLVSNLIGFYRAYSGVSERDIRVDCGEVSVEECYRIWDEHLPNGFGELKNKTLRPMYFSSKACGCNSRAGEFPAFLTGLRMAASGQDWVKLKKRYIDGALINMGATFRVSRNGELYVVR